MFYLKRQAPARILSFAIDQDLAYRYFCGRLAGGTTPFMRKYTTICP